MTKIKNCLPGPPSRKKCCKGLSQRRNKMGLLGFKTSHVDSHHGAQITRLPCRESIF